MRLTKSAAEAVWTILVDEIGVLDHKHDRKKFIEIQTDRHCLEYRVEGLLGFGGKFKISSDRWWVDCYTEDMTPEREILIKSANIKLAHLRRIHLPRRAG